MTLLDGILTFISPCFLPMIPIYISYLSIDNSDKKSKTILNAICFVLGFSLIFIMLGAAASTFGRLLKAYSTYFNIVGGIVIMLFGLNFMGALNIPFLNKTFKPNITIKNSKNSLLYSFLLGIIFSIGWSPCTGAFLGAALVKAATASTVFEGTILLVVYSLGLGIPFIVCAIFISQLKETFSFIKRNYKIINTISGLFLVVVGFLMLSGQFEKILKFLQRLTL